MKKIYLILSLIMMGAIGANAQCVVDQNNTALGFSPPDSLFPNIVQGVQLDNSYVEQAYMPNTFTINVGLPVTVTIYWADIDSASGFPTGITYTRNPTNDTIYGGGRQCILLQGVTNDPAGEYPITFYGTVKVNTIFTGDTVFTFDQLNQLAQSSGGQAPQFGYKLHVVSTNGINDISNELTAAMQIVPNPNNGQFDVKYNYHGDINGDIRVIDVTGRVVYSRAIDVHGLYTTSIDLSGLAKGIYAVQTRTANGMASKLVSIE